MRIYLLGIIALLAGTVFAQPTNLKQEVSTNNTPTEFAISYDAPNGSACTLEVSESNTYTPLVHDVDPVLYTNANLDLSRSDTAVATLHRIVFIGKTGKPYQALNGAWYSRSLQVNTQHFIRVTCGSAATLTVTTSNIPLGQVATTQPLPVAAPFQYAAVSQNPFIQSSWNEPTTGLKIYQYPQAFGAAFAGTTGTGGRTFGCVENLTSGWAASDSGTLTHALSASDGVFAQTATTGAKMFMGLCDTAYNKYPQDSTYTGNELSFINPKTVLIDWTGSGTKTVKIALTRDRNTIIATKTFTATNTPTTITICHPENTSSTCPTANDPGDIWSPDIIRRDEFAIGLGYIYTTGASTTVNFLNVADCNALRVGHLLDWWDQGQGAEYSGHIATMNCGGSPASITLDTTVHADGNGTGGIPFRYASGIANNSQYGFLIWSDDSLAGGLLRIDQGLFVAASYIGGPGFNTCGTGSGGFNKRMQKVKTSGGFTLCAAGNLLFATKGQSDGSMDMRFLGVTFIRTDVVGLANSTGGICGGNCNPVYYDNSTADFAWDDTTAGVFYIQYPQNYDSAATGTQAQGIAKIVLAHPETACGQAGTACVASDPFGTLQPVPDYDATASKALTSATTDIAAQVLVINPSQNFTRFHTPSITSIEDGYIKLKNREGDQDTFSQSFMFDIGNGSPIGGGYVPVHGGTYAAQQIFAFNPTYATKGCKWGEDHTDQPTLYSHAFTTQECGEKTPYRFTITTNIPTCSKAGSGTCDPCPAITVDGVNYTGLSICLHATQTSTWPGGSCGSADPSFTAGDPVNVLGVGNPNFCWLQHQAVGDIVRKNTSGFEALKLIQYNSATDVYYERGCNSNISIDGSPKNWGSNSVWDTIGNSYPVCSLASTEVGGNGQMWDFIGDPLATDTSWTPFQNHGFNVCNGATGVRLHPNYTVQHFDCSSWTSIKAVTPTSAIIPAGTFSGVSTVKQPNAVEMHPSYLNNISATAAFRFYFFDSHPLLFFYEGTTPQHTQIGGAGSFLYKAGNGGHTFDPKIFPIGFFTGQPAFQNVSGPGCSIGTTSADRGKFGIVAVANECTSGSSPGEIYFNAPIDPLQLLCRGVEFWFGEQDVCGGDIASLAGSVVQWLLPTDNSSNLTANHFRVLARHATYRFSVTDNVKPNPDGDYLFFRNDPWYAKLPPFPTADGVDRTHFIGQTITVSSPPAMTSRVMARFFYDAAKNCNDNRAEPCYAVANSVNNSNPFLWEAELVSTSGVPCASSCTVVIPWLEGRVPRYELVYRDSGGATLRTDAMVIGDLSGTPVAPTITTTCPLPAGTVGVSYLKTLSATGTTPITFTDSPLPAGLSLASPDISGTPTTPGTTTGTLQASNSVGNSLNGPLSCALTINAAQVADPTFAPPSGTYSGAQSVTITTVTSGATIRYTTDGSTPSSTVGTIYSSPVTISSTLTLKAIAYKSGSTDSNVVSGLYTITGGGGGPVGGTVISGAATISGGTIK